MFSIMSKVMSCSLSAVYSKSLVRSHKQAACRAGYQLKTKDAAVSVMNLTHRGRRRGGQEQQNMPMLP